MPTHDDFNELEDLIAELPVREPSRMLDERVAATLKEGGSSTRPAASYWLAVAAAVLIAGAVTLVVVFSDALSDTDGGIDMVTGTRLEFAVPDDPSNTSTEGPAIRTVSNPVESVNLTWSRDLSEHNRTTPDGTPFRAVVREVVDHKAWHDPKTGVSRMLCIPREEVIVVKQSPF